MLRFYFEVILIVLSPLAAFAGARYGLRTFAVIMRVSDRLGRFPRLSALGLGALAAASSAAVAHLVWWPQPAIHDEFSYLLASETFASGRLTNPTHPLWHHFESFHVFFEPSYMSKYPPAQGLFLAAGRLMGHPLYGVWLSIGLMISSITWMLQGWLPRSWATLGGFVAVLQFGVAGYWSQSYWGGAAAATGVALIYGALPRLRSRVTHATSTARNSTFSSALLMAMGIFLAATSRPFENLIFCLPAAAILGWDVFLQAKHQGWTSLRTPGLIIASALLATLTFWGIYNHRITGDVLKLPYSAYEEQYNETPVFLWQEDRDPIEYRHRTIAEYWRGWGRGDHRSEYTMPGLIELARERFVRLRGFYFGRILIIPLVFVLFALATRRLWPAFMALLFGFAADMVTTYFLPHYFAAGTALVLLCLVWGFRRMAILGTRERRFGKAWVAFLLIGLCGSTVLAALERDELSSSFGQRRADLVATLEESEGPDLVLVRYGPDHKHDEWVYNAADIDRAPVVWARDRGEELNRALLAYYPDRKVWIFECDFPDRADRLLLHPKSP